jgi:hypothetical protein
MTFGVLEGRLTVGQLQPAQLEGAEQGLNLGRDGLDTIGPVKQEVLFICACSSPSRHQLSCSV